MTATYFHEDPNGRFRAIQYRPDIPNCGDVSVFLGDVEDACCWGEDPHATETWWINADAEAECGDWIILYPSGLVEVISDEFYTGGRP